MLYSTVNQSEFTVVLCHYGCPYSTVAGCSAHSGFADVASQKQPGIKPLLSCLTDFLNIHSSQINFLENGRGYIIL